MAKVIVPFTTGVEEIEFTAVVDLLRRAGVDVSTASLDGLPVQGRSGISIAADAALPDLLDDEWDMVVLPGGQPNAGLLRDDAHVRMLIDRMREQRKSIAAICAAPTALAAYGITEGMRVTSFPACRAEMESLQPSSLYLDDAVVEDDFLVTSRGPGTAIAFGLRLIARLCGDAKAEAIRADIVA